MWKSYVQVSICQFGFVGQQEKYCLPFDLTSRCWGVQRFRLDENDMISNPLDFLLTYCMWVLILDYLNADLKSQHMIREN